MRYAISLWIWRYGPGVETVHFVISGKQIKNLLIASFVCFTLYFIIPRTCSSTQLTENRTTLDL